jgi:hypothetical protein
LCDAPFGFFGKLGELLGPPARHIWWSNSVDGAVIPALIFGNGWESIPPAMEKEVGGKHAPPGGRSLLKDRAPAYAAPLTRFRALSRSSFEIELLSRPRLEPRSDWFNGKRRLALFEHPEFAGVFRFVLALVCGIWTLPVDFLARFDGRRSAPALRWICDWSIAILVFDSKFFFVGRFFHLMTVTWWCSLCDLGAGCDPEHIQLSVKWLNYAQSPLSQHGKHWGISLAAGWPRLSLIGQLARAIAAELAARGYVNENGKEFSAASVASMLGT